MILSQQTKRTMALFSFRHSVKTFSSKGTVKGRWAKAGQTLAHLRYITRVSAARCVLAERLSGNDYTETASKAENDAIRSSGRVCERFTIALPVEARPEQRRELVAAYAEHLTLGVAGYVAAIHDQKGNDIKNPHFHLVCFDAKITKGGRGRPRSVLGMARKNAIETAAHGWACVHNNLMADWGFGAESMIDHRSYATRGIDRIPTIHEGPGSRKITEKQISPKSKPEWKRIDDGHTRAEANQLIKEINNAKEKIDGRRNNRLGTHDEGHADSGKSGVPWRRTNDKGDGGNQGRTNHAHKNLPGTSKGNGSNRGNGEIPRNGPDGAIRKKPTPFQPPFLSPKPIGKAMAEKPGPRPIRRSRVRRIYRELVMMRDTLITRLLRNETPSRVTRVADDLTQTEQHRHPRNIPRGYDRGRD